MDFVETACEKIDHGNDLFRISEELDSQPLVDAMRETGQLNPVILLDRQPRPIIVCGFRRINALAALGTSTVLARIISEESLTPVRLFDLALRDNVSHRRLEPLEAARVLSKLRKIWKVSEERLINDYLPLLGLKPHRNSLRFHMLLHDAHPELRRCLSEGVLTPGGAEILMKAPLAIQGRIASLFSGIRLSASLQRKVFSLLEDLSEINGIRLDEPLDFPGIASIMKDEALSPFQKGEQVHDVLHRMRYPRLSRARERFQEQRKRLGLPGSVRMTPHPFFETNEVRVEFSVSSAEEFRKLAAALHEEGSSDGLDELFRID
jgi:hypothetical protein